MSTPIWEVRERVLAQFARFSQFVEYSALLFLLAAHRPYWLRLGPHKGAKWERKNGRLASPVASCLV